MAAVVVRFQHFVCHLFQPLPLFAASFVSHSEALVTVQSWLPCGVRVLMSVILLWLWRGRRLLDNSPVLNETTCLKQALVSIHDL